MEDARITAIPPLFSFHFNVYSACNAYSAGLPPPPRPQPQRRLPQPPLQPQHHTTTTRPLHTSTTTTTPHHIATTSTTTSTTTATCNGAGDPVVCAIKYQPYDCKDPVDGEKIRNGCPVLCNSCTTTTTTKTTTTTTTTTWVFNGCCYLLLAFVAMFGRR